MACHISIRTRTPNAEKPTEHNRTTLQAFRVAGNQRHWYPLLGLLTFYLWSRFRARLVTQW